MRAEEARSGHAQEKQEPHTLDVGIKHRKQNTTRNLFKMYLPINVRIFLTKYVRRCAGVWSENLGRDDHAEAVCSRKELTQPTRSIVFDNLIFFCTQDGIPCTHASC